MNPPETAMAKPIPQKAIRIDLTKKGIIYLLILVASCVLVYIVTLNIGYYWGFGEGENNVVCTPWVPDENYFKVMQESGINKELRKIAEEERDEAVLLMENNCSKYKEEQENIYKDAEAIGKLRVDCAWYHASKEADSIGAGHIWHEIWAKHKKLCNEKYPLPENL